MTSSGADALLEAYALITGPRQTAYSHPADDYARTVAIFKAITGIELTTQQAILFMVAVKLSRLRHNLARGGWHHDSLVDAIGYLGCLNMAHRAEESSRNL